MSGRFWAVCVAGMLLASLTAAWPVPAPDDAWWQEMGERYAGWPPAGDDDASPERDAMFQDRAGNGDDLQVLYFYYGWYGPGEDGKNWRYGVTDVPQAGYYGSHDLGNARHQFSMIRESGGTGVVHSWWGVNSHDEKSLEVAVKAAEAEGINITASFETWAYEFRDASPEAMAGQLTHVWHRYAQSPAWLKVDGTPVLFVHAAGLHSPEHWEETFRILEERGITFHTYGEVRNKEQTGILSSFNGAYYYMPVELQRDRVYANANREMMEVTDEYDAEWLPTVAYGYDNTPDAIKRHHLVVDDEDGQLFREAWANATRMGSRYVLIGTWNEWNEGTAIEPGEADGGERLALVEQLIREERARRRSAGGT